MTDLYDIITQIKDEPIFYLGRRSLIALSCFFTWI